MPFLFLEPRRWKMERESSKKEGRKEGRSQRCGTKRAREPKRKKRYPVFHISKPCHGSNEIRRKGMGGERGSYNLNLLPNDRLGTRIVPRCQPRRIFHRNEAIPQREIKIPLLFYCTAREIYAPAKLCLISPPDEGGREAWILRKRFDRV